MIMNLKKLILSVLLSGAALMSCTQEEHLEVEFPAKALEFGIGYENYDTDILADGNAGVQALDARSGKSFTPADYDMVEFAVMGVDGVRNREFKGYYDSGTSSIRIEGLREGSYRLLVLGIKGDPAADGASIADIDTMSDVWLSFPSDIGRPLASEYFYSSTPFEIVRKSASGGDILVADIEGPVTQKRAVGRIDFSFAFSKADIEAAVESNIVTIAKPRFGTSMSADGSFSGETAADSWTLDMSEARTFHVLPSPDAETAEGTAEIVTGTYSGSKVRRSYDFVLKTPGANILQNVGIDVVHPDDESGTLYVTEKFYGAGGHGKILQDSEPYETYTDKTLRNFNTSSPLQLSVSQDGKLNVRFYSPRDLHDVLVRAKIPSQGDFFIDLAYFDRIPAFADFKGGIPLTETSAFYRTDTGRIVEIGRKTPEELSGIEFRIESVDPYWAKLEKIVHGWNIRFDLFGGDPTLPDGGPKGNWMGIRPVHCREAVAFFLNFTYMIDMPEHERILHENQDRLYGNGGVDDKVSVETVLSQMRQTRTINVGLVYPGNGVVGLGGGSTFGAYQSGWLSHYDSLYSCEIMFHELGHVMGYSHSSSFTYGPWAQELMNHFYVTHLSEMPIDSAEYLNSASNPNLYR